jgi:transcriptional regulator with XRE-family HTH domain
MKTLEHPKGDAKLAQKLKTYRVHHEITFREMANRAGVSLCMAWRATRGKPVGDIGAGKLWNLILEQK